MNVSLENVPELREAKQIKIIDKGYSADRKYLVTTANDEKVVLRVSAIKNIQKKQEEFKLLQSLCDLGVKISRPISFGVIEEEQVCYMVVSYIEGEDAGERLPTYSEGVQYQVGFVAGEELAKIHTLKTESPVPGWYAYKVNRYYDYLEDYHQGKMKVKQEEKILTFIEDNLSLLKDRPCVFQHGDFHVWNLIVRDKQYQGAIDINRYRFGDPIHEFFKLAFFSREVSIPFSRGQLDGYFNKRVPEKFWRIYCVYVAMGIISSIVWTDKVDPEGMSDMMERINIILEDHDYFNQLKPGWF